MASAAEIAARLRNMSNDQLRNLFNAVLEDARNEEYGEARNGFLQPYIEALTSHQTYLINMMDHWQGDRASLAFRAVRRNWLITRQFLREISQNNEE